MRKKKMVKIYNGLDGYHFFDPDDISRFFEWEGPTHSPKPETTITFKNGTYIVIYYKTVKEIIELLGNAEILEVE